MWRIVLWDIVVIEKGSRWRIGSSLSIDVYKDSWLPKPSTFMISNPPHLPGNFGVAMLCLANGD